VSCAKTAEPIEMQFGVLNGVGARNHVLDGMGSHWRHPANTTERPVCSSNAALGLCQITLSTCYHYLLQDMSVDGYHAMSLHLLNDKHRHWYYYYYYLFIFSLGPLA